MLPSPPDLQTFATEHRKDIKRNPHFRKNFQQMCDLVGVDCLASKKGFWSELLGIGDFYYDLSVQVVGCCLKTRDTNGGLIDIVDLKRLVLEQRGWVLLFFPPTKVCHSLHVARRRADDTQQRRLGTLLLVYFSC